MSDLSKIPSKARERKNKMNFQDIALDNDIFLGLDNFESIDQKFKIYTAASSKSSYFGDSCQNNKRQSNLSFGKMLLATKISFQVPESGRTETSTTSNKHSRLPSQAIIEELQQQKASIQVQSPNQFSRKLIQATSIIDEQKKIVEQQQQQQQQQSSSSQQTISRGSGKEGMKHFLQQRPLNRKGNSQSLYISAQVISQSSINQQKQTATPKANISSNSKLINDYQKVASIIDSSNQIVNKDSKITFNTLNNNPRKSRLSILDVQLFQKNLYINRSISALKQSIAEMGVQNNTKSDNNKSTQNQFMDKLATFIFDFVSSTSQFSKNGWPAPIPTLEKIFSQFNIDKKKYSALKTNEEKEDYVVHQMYSQSSEQLKQMIDRVHKRTIEYAQQDEKQKEKIKNKKNVDELFSWINIPCSFETLKKKVQYSLVEVLYGHDNLQQLQTKNEEFNGFKKEFSPKMRQSTLGEYAELQNNDSLVGGSQISSKKIRSVHLKMIEDSQKFETVSTVQELKKTTQSGTSTQSLKYKNDGSVIGLKQFPNSDFQNTSNQLNKFDDAQFKDADIILREKLNNFKWNYQNERTFLSYKKNAKHSFVGLDSMNRWQSIGMQPIIQKLGLEEKLDLYREQLLNKYQDGINLKESEKIFIINTSQLLISNIDKEYFQSMLDFICTEDILQLEQKIAENVILKYETIAEYLKSQRNDYLREKADRTVEKIAQNPIKNIYDLLNNEKQFKQRKKSLSSQIEKIRRRLERKFELIQYYEKLRHNPYILHFVNQLKKAIAHKELDKKKFKKEESFYQNFEKRNYPQKNHKALFSIAKGSDEIPINYKDSQKIYHPSSRLLLGLNELTRIEEIQKSGRNRNYLTDMTPMQQKQLEMQRATNVQYTNKQQDSKRLTDQQPNFAEFYSNGPIQSRDFKNKNLIQVKEKHQLVDGFQAENCVFKKPHQWISKQIENKSAIIIQKWIRRHLQIKRFREILGQKRDTQEKKMFSILKNWKDSKELMAFIKDQAMQIARQKKQLAQKKQRKLSGHIYASQPNSPRSNTSTISISNNHNNKQSKENAKQILSTANQYAKHKKGLSENNIHQNHAQNIIPNEKDHSDSISSINSKISKHSYFGSMTSTKVGGTLTNDFSIYGLNPRVLKKKSLKSTDESLNQNLSHRRNSSDFFSPRSNFLSRQIIPQSAVFNSQVIDNLPNSNHHQSIKEFKGQIEEDVNMENEQAPHDLHQTEDHQSSHQEDFSKKLNDSINLKRKFTVTGNQLRNQISKMKDGLRDFSKKREELLLKQKKLFYGAKHGSLQTIKNSGFIFYPHDINSLDEKGNCPLYYATKKADEQLIDFLLKGEADVNMRCLGGNTPLHVAFEIGKEKIIIDYLDKGGDLNIVNSQGQTPLAFGSMKLLKMIGLERGITNIDIQSIGQRIDYDNNKIFHDNHNIIEMSNHIKELNSPITIIKKRKEKKVDEEIAQQQMYFNFMSTASTLDPSGHDTFGNGVKHQQISSTTGQLITQLQTYIEPQFRSKLNSQSTLEISSKL